MSYRALFFDLFDTLVLFDRDRLPEVQVNGRTVRSTAGRLHEAFGPWAPDVGLPAFADALFWSWQEAERIRAETHREVTAPERLTMLVRRLGLHPDPRGVQALLETHMRELSRAMTFPAHHAALLADLHGRFRLAVVSNFDYTPTARMVLEREGVADLFDAIVVSDEVGWRKPRPDIFEMACRRVGVAARDVLFVGDRLDADVAGARQVGMGTAWINRPGAAVPDGQRPPDFDIRDLAELRGILGI